MRGGGSLLIVVTGDPVEPVAARHGGFPAIIAAAIEPRWSGAVHIVDARRDDPFGAAKGTDAIVITGSPEHVHHRAPWMLATEAWLRDEVRTGRPTLGLCFGHQLLASALGGEVAPNPSGREMGSVQLERILDDPLVAHLPERFTANTCHLDTVTRPPSGTATLARSALDAHQFLRFTPTCYGVQFHPEFNGAVMRGYVEARRDALVAEGFDADAMLRATRDTPHAASVLSRFLTHFVS